MRSNTYQKMKITIIGCGNMGVAYAKSLRKYNIVTQEDLLLVEKNEERKDHLKSLEIGNVIAGIGPNVSECNIIILSVKPQDFSTIANDLAKYLKPENIVLSIMAGITISRLQESLKHQNVVRAMPNSPAQIGMGITGYTSGQALGVKQVLLIEKLLNSTGRSVHLENESMLDSVTALSGSGPAYFFYIVKAMIEAGKQMGLEDDVAAAMVKQTMLGSFHLVNHSAQSLDDLIKAVASKGGTTEAALNVFKELNLDKTLIKGILAAEKRSRELSRS